MKKTSMTQSLIRSLSRSLSPSLTSSLSPSLSPTGASLGAIVGGSTAVVILVVILVVALINVCISVLLLFRRRGRSYRVKEPHAKFSSTITTQPQPDDHSDIIITLPSEPRAGKPAGEDAPDSHEPCEAQKLDAVESLKEVLNKLESDNLLIPHKNFKLETKIGNGFFGEVFEAKGKKIIAKTCKSTNSDAMKCQFLYEADILRHYKHPNIVLLIGVVANELDPLSIVMEHVGCTFLYFLKAENGQECDRNVLIEMCKQVCEGMEYLERKNCVHRGLTARNCLVSDHNNIVKISNFGMSLGKVHLDPSDPRLRPTPTKWTAPEALKYGRFSSASDVWSFGVLLWETFSRGKEPYGVEHKDKVREKVKRGYRMNAPKDCPSPVFDVMLECWEYDQKNRPKFAELLTELCKLIRPKESKEDSEASDHEQ